MDVRVDSSLERVGSPSLVHKETNNMVSRFNYFEEHFKLELLYSTILFPRVAVKNVLLRYKIILVRFGVHESEFSRLLKRIRRQRTITKRKNSFRKQL